MCPIAIPGALVGWNGVGDWDVARAYLCIVEPRYIDFPVRACFCSCILSAVDMLSVDGSHEKLLRLDSELVAPVDI